MTVTSVPLNHESPTDAESARTAHPAGCGAVSGRGAPGVVFDTNALLDWLVFANPACAGWTGWLEQRSVHWLASEPMRDELAHVLARGVGAARQFDLEQLWRAWDRFVVPVPPKLPQGAASRLRCTDVDDQKFIDAALAHGARWLVSRDRAVLKLARRARPFGLSIVTPQSWTGEFNAR